MLVTPFAELLEARLPLQQAPMGGVTTPELVAAVAGAGAVGMVPAQMLPADALAGLLDDLAGRTSGVVGVTFLLPFGADPAAVEVAVREQQAIGREADRVVEPQSRGLQPRHRARRRQRPVLS